MLTHRDAIDVEAPTDISSDALADAVAMQEQGMRDSAPCRATAPPFARNETTIDDIPLCCWPLIVVDEPWGAAGNDEDRDGQPFALVEAGESWSLSASHEVLETVKVNVSHRRPIHHRDRRSASGTEDLLYLLCRSNQRPGAERVDVHQRKECRHITLAR
ncbi:MAG: hypothetical protein J0L91_01260 [Burkholderiales bacterium]|nr:hypothetical protein [Burkholderiales bacterium]